MKIPIRYGGLCCMAIVTIFICCQQPDVLDEACACQGKSVNVAEVSIDLANGKAISPLIYGVNNDWRQVSDDRFNTFAQRLNQINSTLIRFPGGWESEYYDWNTNTTPGWKNSPEIAGASVETVKSNTTSKLSIVVPTTPAMNESLGSSKWLEKIAYCKEQATLAIAKTGVHTISSIEIGNEWWLQWAGGVPRNEKLIKYAQIAKRIASHIKEVYPESEFKLLVNGDYTAPKEFTVINQIFENDLIHIDGLALHTYAGYESESHDIRKLRMNVEACQSNLGRDYLSLSEWAPSKKYNNNKVYAESASLMAELINEYAWLEADESAFWPPTNNSIPGLGLFNYGLNKEFPSAQLFKDLAANFKGEVLEVTHDKVNAIAAKNENGNVVVYLMGNELPCSKVSIALQGASIEKVSSSSLWSPGDLNNPDAALPMNITQDVPFDFHNGKVSITLNDGSLYNIYKIVLTPTQS